MKLVLMTTLFVLNLSSAHSAPYAKTENRVRIYGAVTSFDEKFAVISTETIKVKVPRHLVKSPTIKRDQLVILDLTDAELNLIRPN